MQQKVQFIATVLHEPKLVLLDEPFTGLDPINTESFKEIIEELQQEGRAVVLSTHVMEQVEKLCKRICLINKGRKILEGPLADIKMQFGRNVVTLRFSGNPAHLERHPGVEHVGTFGEELTVTLAEGTDTNLFLRHALEGGKVEKFEIGEMSLHDIFIAKVKSEGGEVHDEAIQGR
jgi:ABC-2 type transport system ATP-binding protein